MSPRDTARFKQLETSSVIIQSTDRSRICLYHTAGPQPEFLITLVTLIVNPNSRTLQLDLRCILLSQTKTIVNT